MKNKLKLDQLRIESFVTSLADQEKMNIAGGQSSIFGGSADGCTAQANCFATQPFYPTCGGTCWAGGCQGPTLSDPNCMAN